MAKTSIRGGFGMFYDILKGEDNLQFNGQPPFFASVGLTFPTGGNNPDSSLFGQNTSTFDPRMIQLAGRFSF